MHMWRFRFIVKQMCTKKCMKTFNNSVLHYGMSSTLALVRKKKKFVLDNYRNRVIAKLCGEKRYGKFNICLIPRANSNSSIYT